MKDFFKENKIFIAIIIAALVTGAAIYFGLQKDFGDRPLTPPDSSICSVSSEAVITKVLDGDTVIAEGGHHIRLLGIDADEAGSPCYEEAKSRLEELVLNKEVELKEDQTDVDQYGRCLRYIFLNGQNINSQLVKEGLAVARFYEPDVKYKDEIASAEKEAIEEEIGCKWSSSENSLGTEPNTSLEWNDLVTEKLGYDVVLACKAGQYLGRELIVEGKVAGAYHDLESNTVFLNLEKAYPNQCFTGIIFSSDLHKFVQSPEEYYLNKTIRIMGEVKEYKGRPQIILENPNQIEIGKQVF